MSTWLSFGGSCPCLTPWMRGGASVLENNQTPEGQRDLESPRSRVCLAVIQATYSGAGVRFKTTEMTVGIGWDVRP